MRIRKEVQREPGDFIGSIQILFYSEKSKVKIDVLLAITLRRKKSCFFSVEEA